MNAQGTMKQISGNSHSEVMAQLRGISLADMVRTLGPATQSSSATVAGVLNAEAKLATWGKSFEDLVAHADATVKATGATRTRRCNSGRNGGAGWNSKCRCGCDNVSARKCDPCDLQRK